MSTVWDPVHAEQVYCAYGADLIKTGGGLVRTTPSVVFRACALFQRFQVSISANYRSHYRGNEDGKPTGASPSEGKVVEYTVPEYAGTDYLPSGLVPLIDLHAPLDFSIYFIVEHEDISYLCAACLLIAAKMEDPGVRIRPIVDAFARLGNRRCGIMVNELLKPPPERYDDFKSCVVKAEEMVLQELGFQTFVETPYKYAVVYLNLLVDDQLAVSSSTDQDDTSAHSPVYISWLSAAVNWLNDVPRCRNLIKFPTPALAVCALRHSCPAAIAAQLSENWYTALGVSEGQMVEMQQVYEAYLGRVKVSAKDELDAIRAMMPKPAYRKASQTVEATPLQSGKPADAAAAPENVKDELQTTAAKSLTPPPPQVTADVIRPKRDELEDEEDDGMDLLALRKKRRREEKEKERRERHRRDKDKKHH